MKMLAENVVYVRQRRELAELAGFETRNKYEIAAEGGRVVGFAAEQQKGFLQLIVRHFLGHWRTFEIHFFTEERQTAFIARHPFRWLFQRLEIFTPDGQLLGAVQQRFSVLKKRFDIENASGKVILETASPFWKIWTFPIERDGVQVALIEKKWTGFLKEAFTDADNFRVDFLGNPLPPDARRLVLAAAVFVDLQYFEKKAR